jgi:hypothetical protein
MVGAADQGKEIILIIQKLGVFEYVYIAVGVVPPGRGVPRARLSFLALAPSLPHHPASEAQSIISSSCCTMSLPAARHAILAPTRTAAGNFMSNSALHRVRSLCACRPPPAAAHCRLPCSCPPPASQQPPAAGKRNCAHPTTQLCQQLSEADSPPGENALDHAAMCPAAANQGRTRVHAAQALAQHGRAHPSAHPSAAARYSLQRSFFWSHSRLLCGQLLQSRMPVVAVHFLTLIGPE